MNTNKIEVVGSSSVEIEPDLIYVKVVITNQYNPKFIIQLSNFRYVLNDLGIDTVNDVKLVDEISNYKRIFIDWKNIRQLYNYQIIVHDVKMLANLYVELKYYKIDDISIIGVSHSELSQINSTLKIEAIKNAKTIADSLVRPLNQQIGKAFYIYYARS